MSITVVGVFATHEQAQDARSRLEDLGLAGATVRFTGTRQFDAAGVHDERPGSVRRLLAEMFGIGENAVHAGRYAEALLRGSAVITVRGAEALRIDEIRDVLRKCGAIDIDQHADADHHDESPGPRGGALSMRRYSGPERRHASGSYVGVERRALH